MKRGKLHKNTRLHLVLALLAVVSVVGGCSGDDDGGGAGSSAAGRTTTSAEGGYRVRKVPADYPTIQKAVDAASPGDLVLISPGVYHEAVDIETENLTIRGLDRNTTILDGRFDLDNGLRVVGANGVAIENLTARNYLFNGFFWTGVDGFRGSYLTATRNGDYGIYGFGAVNGLFEHSYGSGSPDAGIYLGQCNPCKTVINDILSEYNGLGYSGTNSGGDLYIINSTFRFNRSGVVPNSGSYELCYPERNTTIVGNTVYSNNNSETPAIDAALLAQGTGIFVAGGTRNLIERNLVFDHDITGIGLIPFPESNPSDVIPERDPGRCDQAGGATPDPASLPDSLLWPAEYNVVRDNDVSDSRIADLSTADAGASDTPDGGNCFAGNTFESSAPTDIEVKAPCDGVAGGDFSSNLHLVEVLLTRTVPESVSFQTASTPEPPEQPNMPDAATAPPRPAVGLSPVVDVDSIKLPVRPAGA